MRRVEVVVAVQRRVSRGRLSVRHHRRIATRSSSTIFGPCRITNGRVVLADHVIVVRGCDLVGPVSLGLYAFVNTGCFPRPRTTLAYQIDVGQVVEFNTDSYEVGSPGQRVGQITINVGA